MQQQLPPPLLLLLAAAVAPASGPGPLPAMSAGDSTVQPPERFGVVAPQLYRSSVFHPVNFTFLSQLRLKTILHLSPEVTLRAVENFIKESNIRLVHLGIKFWKPSHGWRPTSEELLKEALEMVLDVRNHPLMLMCTSGVHQTGTVVGCLRRIQRYSFTSIIDELRSFAFPGHTRYASENFIEFFDVDVVSLPEKLPDWFRRRREVEEITLRALADRHSHGLGMGQGQGPAQGGAGAVEPAYLVLLGTTTGPLVTKPLEGGSKDVKDKSGDGDGDDDDIPAGKPVLSKAKLAPASAPMQVPVPAPTLAASSNAALMSLGSGDPKARKEKGDDAGKKPVTEEPVDNLIVIFENEARA